MVRLKPTGLGQALEDVAQRRRCRGVVGEIDFETPGIACQFDEAFGGVNQIEISIGNIDRAELLEQLFADIEIAKSPWPMVPATLVAASERSDCGRRE